MYKYYTNIKSLFIALLLDHLRMLIEQKIYAESRQIRRALVRLSLHLNPSHFLTPALNRTERPDVAARMLKELYAAIDRKLFGKNFYKLNSIQRTISINFPEHMESNYHFHSFIHVPKSKRVKFQFYSKYFEAAWRDISKSGNLKIIPIYTLKDACRAVNYSLKENFKFQNYENFIVSSEFWNSNCSRTININDALARTRS